MATNALTVFEGTADRTFEAFQVPHPNFYVSAWYLLTASEDAQRNWFHSDLDVRLVMALVDKEKFSLRSCLALARRKCRDRTQMPLPERVIPQLYVRAREMMNAGTEYAVVAQVCGSVYAGAATVNFDGKVVDVTVNPAQIDPRYGALELMRQSAASDFVPALFVKFWVWVRYEDTRPDVLNSIAASIQVKNRRVHYTFEPLLSLRLVNELEQVDVIIPKGWQFPWGGRHETILLMNALGIRLMYHVCAVHFGSVEHGLAGGAEHDLVLCQTEDEWVQDILENSSLEHEQIRIFVRFLTYGNGVSSPDQALQPFVPLGRGLLAVPALAYLSSNVDRNLLTLQARVASRAFDEQSNLFEVEMTRNLEEIFRNKWTHVACSRTFTLAAFREELDLLVCEPETKTLLVMELRWILSPADPREVQSKKAACQGKVPQVQRKRDAVRANLSQLLSTAFGIQAQDDGWQVDAMVVIEGFGGAPTIDATVPIIPEWVLAEGVQHACTLRELVAWSLSASWLPIDGRDFESRNQAQGLLGMQVRFTGVFPLRDGRPYLEDATAVLRAA